MCSNTSFLFFIAVPLPKRQKCDHWSPCLPGSYAYRILSGGGKEKFAKICFEDELLISEEKGNVGRGINIAVVNYNTGKVIATKYFDMWEGENLDSRRFKIKLFPYLTHRLKEDGKQAIAELGSKEIRNLKFRSSWVFIAGKGFKLPENIEKEKVKHVLIKKSKLDYNPMIDSCLWLVISIQVCLHFYNPCPVLLTVS
ncbi:hypothetical protein JD844_032654 [Phrynosoma platyrhinos]|uniref:ILEI/PANDER domain-containing protein n=1 Tax=Phrynosoma platyrhinos TaxID=52577 RepID=A0ABQ7T4Y5_PHRPL|nr:hypothetical protein JD844_032654 [Phrynosoma platyrhinos]